MMGIRCTKQPGPIVTYLMIGQAGFEGVALGQETSCNSLRTITVWDTEEDMVAFTMSAAHVAAEGQIGTLSRGTSDFTTWSSDGSDVSFTTAAAKLGADGDGGI